MTLRVYTVDAATGRRTDLPTVDPSPVAFPGQSHNFPPCLCPRCLPCAADIEQDRGAETHWPSVRPMMTSST